MAAPIKSLGAFRTVNKIHACHKISRNLIALHQLFTGSRNCGLHLKYGSFVSHFAQEKMASEG
jgi:hypothetical protein